MIKKTSINLNFKDDFLEKERLTFEEDNKFGWREKCEEEGDVEEYMTTTMKQLGLTKARSSVKSHFLMKQAHSLKIIFLTECSRYKDRG